ncbi:hypothetical protein IC620_00045 [Hazenella sp. IB182357]|uniref:Deacetylase PdaC domain-containing protein n=1 Tax=Polycladospora coralii TaxID=2771432 RepID=A0A926N8J9_9BACL|nr:hypothetical protein [Polycladospora coralii]MBD1370750.1 hypothetical protein [Polycladospora coralii]MBS7529688.1 hypothetical protein [Polycladospora coralii]
MRRILFSVFIFVVCVSMSGCTAPQTEESEHVAVEETKFNYQIKPQTYKKSETEVIYPQIEGNMPAKEDKINSIIRDNALKILSDYESYGKRYFLKINYEIALKNEKLLSIRYIGSDDVDDEMYNKGVYYTSTIDLQNESAIKLTDVLKVDQQLIDLLQSEQPIVMRDDYLADAHRQDIQMMPQNTLLSKLNEADQLDFSDYDDFGLYSYYTDKRLGIGYATGGHALGEYAIFELPYTQLKSIQKKDHVLWDIVDK